MPEVRDLEAKLVALRREIADGRRCGFTPTQLRLLQATCCELWAAVERHKYGQVFELAAAHQ
ncbi:MAG TPA: hypothetical protein VKX28_29175 [Xanthobacteraceae bacterium]|nr:hypothetical protein [Xanthobacteraceae bacterium]